MKKEEYIKKYGQAAYEGHRQRRREWIKNHPEKNRERSREWKKKHPEEAKATSQAANQESNHKGGKYYEGHRQHQMTGIPHEKELVRRKHEYKWAPFKQIIAPNSQLHHEWLPNTSDYRGIALVEKDQHMHGYIDVIQILEGEITLLTEEEIRTGGIINYE